MRRYLGQLDTILMFGVGAAFDFHTGRIKDAPQWIKSSGLQWLHRLMQDPRRLWKRYIRNNPAFLWHITLQLTGLREYPSSRNGTKPWFPSLAREVSDQGIIASDRGIKRASQTSLTK